MSSSDAAPVHLLGIAGSLRSGAYSKTLIATLAAAQRAPITMSVHDLGAVPLYNEDLDGDRAPDAVREFKQAIDTADGLVIVTPEYNYGLPGVLKNALDWASRPGFSSVLKDKPVLPISTSPAYTGGVRALADLKLLLLATLSRVVAGPEVVITGVNAKIEDGRFIDTDNLEFAQKQIDRLIAMARA